MKPKNPYKNGASLVFDVPRWDEYQWKTFRNRSPDTTVLVERGEDKLFAFPAFAKETFHRLYNPSPRALDVVKPEHTWAKAAHHHISQLPEFERLSRRCRGDRFFSGIAATTFCEVTLENLPEPSEELKDPQPLREQVRGLKGVVQHAQGEGSALPENVSEMLSQLMQEGQQSVLKALEYAEELDASSMRQAFRSACESAEERVQEVQGQMEAFSFGSHEGVRGSGGCLEEKMKMAQRIQSSVRLQKIAREAGRLRRIAAQKQRSKAEHTRSEVSSLESGNDLSRLLPAELVKLTDPFLFGLFAKGFTERSLLQYRLSGKERQGQGPVVVCLDSSGSMEGEREVWSKAVALALLSIAVAQKRTCRLIHFDGSVQRVDDFSAGKIETKDLLASMDAFFGGGTNLARPLIRALDAIEREKEFKKADVILITDGEYTFDSDFLLEWHREVKRLEFTTYGVVIGLTEHSELQKLTSHVMFLPDLTEEREVLNSLFCI